MGNGSPPLPISPTPPAEATLAASSGPAAPPIGAKMIGTLRLPSDASVKLVAMPARGAADVGCIVRPGTDLTRGCRVRPRITGFVEKRVQEP